MEWTVPSTDVLLKVLGAPHHTELVTSLFRLSQALLDRGATVQVWTCAEATALTRADVGDSKPPDLTDWTVDYPSTARLVRELLTSAPGRISWYACWFCCLDRGAYEQIPEVRVRPPARFWEHVLAADKTVVLGVC
jgi:sulfur relay (sulfurtransferase) complex TusBCD TusD component (DsrE family)